MIIMCLVQVSPSTFPRDYCHLHCVQHANHAVSFQRCWRLAYAFCFVEQLSHIARARPCFFFFIVALPNCQEDEVTLREPLKILSALLRQRGACSLCWPWEPSRARTVKTKRAPHRVDRLAHIAREGPRRTLCRASELQGGQDCASRNS